MPVGRRVARHRVGRLGEKGGYLSLTGIMRGGEHGPCVRRSCQQMIPSSARYQAVGMRCVVASEVSVETTRYRPALVRSAKSRELNPSRPIFPRHTRSTHHSGVTGARWVQKASENHQSLCRGRSSLEYARPVNLARRLFRTVLKEVSPLFSIRMPSLLMGSTVPGSLTTLMQKVSRRG
jgi:hypothetical protein